MSAATKTMSDTSTASNRSSSVRSGGFPAIQEMKWSMRDFTALERKQVG